MDILLIFATIGMILKYGWPFFLLAMLIIAKIKWKNWPIDVVIIEKRGENLIKTNDRGGKYIDKFTGLTGYRMLKSKDTIPSINYDWILHCNMKHLNLLERLINILRPTEGTLFLFKYGSKQYKPLKPNFNANVKMKFSPMKDEEGKTIYTKNYLQFDPRGSLGVIDFEVVDWDNMNFMVQEMRASFERRQKQKAWIKTILIPLSLIAVAGLVSIIMMKFSLDWSKAVPSGTPPPQQADPNPKLPIIGNVVTPGK